MTAPPAVQAVTGLNARPRTGGAPQYLPVSEHHKECCDHNIHLACTSASWSSRLGRRQRCTYDHPPTTYAARLL